MVNRSYTYHFGDSCHPFIASSAPCRSTSSPPRPRRRLPRPRRPWRCSSPEATQRFASKPVVGCPFTSFSGKKKSILRSKKVPKILILRKERMDFQQRFGQDGSLEDFRIHPAIPRGRNHQPHVPGNSAVFSGKSTI